jgi:EAL domain-containing protein (putative c-di-GMP-specific phosphodiesterase class I)
LSRLPELAAAVHRLRGIGYGLAIDDVGPELRDHAPLLSLPFTMLKLDQLVVQETARSPAARDFVGGAIDAARLAGLKVTAEGVEDEACWRRMDELGIEFAQGFLVARPMPHADIAGWHTSWTGRQTP